LHNTVQKHPRKAQRKLKKTAILFYSHRQEGVFKGWSAASAVNIFQSLGWSAAMAELAEPAPAPSPSAPSSPRSNASSGRLDDGEGQPEPQDTTVTPRWSEMCD